MPAFSLRHFLIPLRNCSFRACARVVYSSRGTRAFGPPFSDAFFGQGSRGNLLSKMRKWAFALVAALAGCQTPYQDMGYDGGVSAAPITNNVYRISARGNGFTDPTTVQDYSLLKAAEVTLQSGHTHFIVVDSSNATTRDFGQTPGTFQTNVIGNTAYTTYNPGVTYDIVKPGQDLLIQVGTPAPGQVPPLGAFPAQQVYDNTSPRVQRPR